MQNLIQFLLKNGSIFLFLVLQVMCFVFIVKYNKEQKAIFEATTTFFSGWVYSFTDSGLRYVKLDEKSEKLALDNARLFSQLEASKFNNIIVLDSTSNQEYLQQYDFTTAKVVNNTTNRSNNYITINRGTNHGIKKHSAVIGSEGIVGIVIAVSNRYAVVMSLLHQQTKVSAAVKNKGYFGSLVWKTNNSTHLNLAAVPRHAKVEKGDTIVTSGYSSLFPGGIMVGQVDKVQEVEGSSFHEIDILLSEDLNKLNYVYVVNNLFQEEQQKLEESVKHE